MEQTTSPEIRRADSSESPRPHWFRSSNPSHGPVLAEADPYASSDGDAEMRKSMTAHEAPISRPQSLAPWKIYWRSPVLMVFLFLAGVVFALAHHFHYAALDGTAVASELSQQWAIRIGTGLAFLAKASLAASVGVAYTQRLWVTVKKKAISLGNLDNVFSLTSDPLSFFSFEVLFKAKMLCVLAACMWLIPIVATITPATLAVRSGLATNVTTEQVPIVDFASIPWSSVVNMEGNGRVSSSSAAVNRLLAATSSSMSILPFTAPYPNSSYTLDFFAPAIKCENLSTAVANTTFDLGTAPSLQSAWDATMPGLMTKWTNLTELPHYTSPYFYTASANLSWTSMYGVLFLNAGGATGQNYTCHLWNASYTVAFASTNGAQSTTLTSLTHTAPKSIEPMGYLPTDYAPGDVPYWALWDALTNLAAVQLGTGATGTVLNPSSTIYQTGLAACPEIRNASTEMTTYLAPQMAAWMCRAGSLPRALEDLSHNLTLSLLSDGLFAFNTTSAAVRVTAAQNYYAYNVRNLAVAYAAAAAVAIACVAVGAAAYLANGYSASSSFSSILFTTRNGELDRLAEGQCLGAQPMPREVRGVKLRFGVLEDGGSGVAHAAFGLRGTVGGLGRGVVCS